MSAAAPNLLQRIRRADPAHAATIESHGTDVAYDVLPFYHRHRIARVRVQLPYESIDFRYADDGQALIPFHSTEADIEKLNRLEKLQLEARDVVAYARYFLANADKRFILVEGASDMPWTLPAMDSAELQAQSLVHVRPARVTIGDRAMFRVDATALSRGALIELRLNVFTDGRVHLLSEKTLVPKLPVAIN